MKLWVYSIAFRKDEDTGSSLFVMVRSRKRGAWEMPGGRVEVGEDPLDAAVREFLEETGFVLEACGRPLQYEGGLVFCGTYRGDAPSPRQEEILEVREFSDLPQDLAFPFVEYAPMIESCRRMLKIT